MFKCKFKDNGNSMSTCFQFEEVENGGRLRIKIKFYWKSLQLFQSEGAKKTVGMKTKDLFCPDVHMSEALRQTILTSLSRVEITYFVESVMGQH